MEEIKIPDQDKYYSASKVINEKFLGDWMKSTMTFTSLLKTEKGQRIFNPIIKTSGKYNRYFIKGSAIIGAQEMIKAGALKL